MRSLEECKAEIFRQGEQKIQRRRRTVRRVTGLACCGCLMAAVGVGLWRGEVPTPPTTPAISAGTTTVPPSTTSATPSTTPTTQGTMPPPATEGDIPSIDMGFTSRGGKQMWLSLFNALSKAAPDEVLALGTSMYEDDTFVYQGKTLRQYRDEAERERRFRDVLGSLLKEGEYLKYGEALYTTGTPDGIRWDKGLYDKTVAGYGEELLARYIVDGVFLKEQLQRDIDTYHEIAAQQAYAQARRADAERQLAQAEQSLQAQGVRFERTADGQSLRLFVTVAQFDALWWDGIDTRWCFGLQAMEGKPQDQSADDIATAIQQY